MISTLYLFEQDQDAFETLSDEEKKKVSDRIRKKIEKRLEKRKGTALMFGKENLVRE